MTAIRELWADQCNLALAGKGLTEHIDHRSLKAQGIEKAELRHDIRKDRAEWRAERLKEEKKERRLAEERERSASRIGMSR